MGAGGARGLPDASAASSRRVKGLCMDGVWRGRGKNKAIDKGNQILTGNGLNQEKI